MENTKSLRKESEKVYASLDKTSDKIIEEVFCDEIELVKDENGKIVIYSGTIQLAFYKELSEKQTLIISEQQKIIDALSTDTEELLTKQNQLKAKLQQLEELIAIIQQNK